MLKDCLNIALLLVAGTLWSGNIELPFRTEPLHPRKITVGSGTAMLLKSGQFEIVVPAESSKTAKFAAQECADALSRVFGQKITPRASASGKFPAICIGDLKLAKSLGIDPEKFDRDGFVIRTAGTRILIIGKDDPKSDPKADVNKYAAKGEWATLFGTYDFLERFAGIRYYFPGELGTVAPRVSQLKIPEINIYDRPDFLTRRFNDYNHGGRPIRRYAGWDGALNRLRNRAETLWIPNNHGLGALGYQWRFGKSHPEYFALNSDGSRMIQVKHSRHNNTHLCFSSGIRKEIVADAVSFLRKEPSSKRGVLDTRQRPRWSVGVFEQSLPCFNMMPQDGCYLCRCQACQKHFAKGKQATSDFFWQFFNHVANEVKKQKVQGYLTTMAYAEYKALPTVDIADNILVMLALRGPWNEYIPVLRDADVKLLEAWYKKLGHKLWLWTYPGKYYGHMPGIPHTTPRALQSFIRRARPYIFGLYIECESDVLLFNYLTYYIFGKLAWNNDADVEQLLDQHTKDLYGPAAAPMKDFFDSIERNWQRIAANAVETPMGPKTVYPSELVLWNKIYTPAELKRLTGLFDRAEKLAARDALVLKRIKFVRGEMLQPMLNEAAAYRQLTDSVEGWKFPVSERKKQLTIDGSPDDPGWQDVPELAMSGLNGAPAEVETGVKMVYDKENFYFLFRCMEPDTALMQGFKRKHDDLAIWKDSDVELFISPDGSKERVWQLMVNHCGALSDLEVFKGVVDFKWNSGAVCKTKVIPGKAWYAEIALPRKSMAPASPDQILINFGRHRALKDKKVGTECYSWSPFVRHYGDLSRFGALSFRALPENLIKNGDFAGTVKKKFFTDGSWRGEMVIDKNIFVTGGSSVRLEVPEAKVLQNSSAIQSLKGLKPNTEYLLSFIVKLENVKPRSNKYSGFYLRLDDRENGAVTVPAAGIYLSGSCNWHRFEGRLKTGAHPGKNGAPYAAFVLRNATGKAWIDHVKLIEVKK